MEDWERSGYRRMRRKGERLTVVDIVPDGKDEEEKKEEEEERLGEGRRWGRRWWRQRKMRGNVMI